MADRTYTEEEVRSIVKATNKAAVSKRDLELASALNSLLEVADSDPTRVRVGIEMLARTLIASPGGDHR